MLLNSSCTPLTMTLVKNFKKAYPTVVMVTKAHQTPCPIPRKELDGNWAELVLCSYMGREEVISCRA